MPATYKPKIFVSRKPSLFLVDPKNPPHHDKATGEAVWAGQFQFTLNTYTTKGAKEEGVLLNHPAYGKEFWLETDKPVKQTDVVLDTVTVPQPPNVVVP